MKKTILLVDDEALHREFLFLSLNENYDLWIASDYEKALSWIQSSPNISILVTDYYLSDSRGRTGMDLAEVLRNKDPNAKIVMVTGAILTELERKRLINQVKATLLEKPCRIENLVKLVG